MKINYVGKIYKIILNHLFFYLCLRTYWTALVSYLRGYIISYQRTSIDDYALDEICVFQDTLPKQQILCADRHSFTWRMYDSTMKPVDFGGGRFHLNLAVELLGQETFLL